MKSLKYKYKFVETGLDFGNNFFTDNGTNFDTNLVELKDSGEITENFVYLKMMKKNSDSEPQVIVVGKSATKSENGNKNGIDLQFDNYPDSGYSGYMLHKNRELGWNWDSSQIIIISVDKKIVDTDGKVVVVTPDGVEKSLKIILNIFGS